MSQHQESNENEQADVLGSQFDFAAPPRRPAPMPTQVIEFWTLFEIGAALLRSLAVFRRLPAAHRPDLPAPKSNEQMR